MDTFLHYWPFIDYQCVGGVWGYIIVPIGFTWAISLTVDSGELGSWWHHQMETFSALLALCGGKLAGHRWIPHTKTSDAELWCFLRSEPWLNGCVNNREARDLRRHGANYDVTIMNLELLFDVWLICAKLQPVIDDLKYDQISYREMILIHNKDHGDVIIYRNASFLTFWDENPTVSIGFFLQRVINSMPWFFLYL